MGEQHYEEVPMSEQIRKLRKRLLLTQEQFAAKVGVTFSTVSRWENATSTPSPLATRRIKELENELEVSK